MMDEKELIWINIVIFWDRYRNFNAEYIALAAQEGSPLLQEALKLCGGDLEAITAAMNIKKTREEYWMGFGDDHLSAMNDLANKMNIN